MSNGSETISVYEPDHYEPAGCAFASNVPLLLVEGREHISCGDDSVYNKLKWACAEMVDIPKEDQKNYPDERQKGKLETQGLLLPLIIELTPQQQVILENISTELNSCGFEVEPFGHRTLAIKSVPTDLTTADLKKLLGELLDGLEKETQQVSLERIKEKIAASIACHAAIKVNTHLEHSKMIWLIDELLKTKYPTTCPHGRPIILRYKKTEILKAFKRI